jgi:hypothetical protein
MANTVAKTGRVVDHRYYYAVSIGFVAVVFAGFARTYYLKGWYGAPPLSLLVHTHGVVMTLWYTLFVVQVRLVATHRVALHRRLGVAGVFLAGLVAVLGTTVSLGLAKRRLLAHPDSTAAPFLLGLQLFAIVLEFVILVSLAVYLRRRPDYHKRLMTLAMLSVLGPAITRLPLSFVENHNVSVAIVISISCILICVIADTVRNRRLHPVFGWGGSLMIGSIFLVAGFAQTSAWIHFARWLLT